MTMPNPNAIVGAVVRIGPPIPRSGVETMRANPNGLTVELEGDRTARLYPSERAGAYADILEGLRRMRRPAYVEVQPDTRAITLLLMETPPPR